MWWLLENKSRLVKRLFLFLNTIIYTWPSPGSCRGSDSSGYRPLGSGGGHRSGGRSGLCRHGSGGGRECESGELFESEFQVHVFVFLIFFFLFIFLIIRIGRLENADGRQEEEFAFESFECLVRVGKEFDQQAGRRTPEFQIV